MSINPQNAPDLQGIYKFGKGYIYLAWQPVDETFMYTDLKIGTPVGTYNTMRTFFASFDITFLRIPPVYLGTLLPTNVPSDLYPELLI